MQIFHFFKVFLHYFNILPPYLHTSGRRLSKRILASRSIGAVRPLECTVAHRCCFLKIIPCSQVKWNALHYHYTQHYFSRNRGALVLERKKPHSVYCNAVCLFSSRFPGWLLTWSYSISYYWLTVWWTSTLVSWKPNKSNKMWHGTHYDMKNELLTPKCHLCLTFAAQSHVMERESYIQRH